MGCKNLCSLSPEGAPYSKPLFGGRRPSLIKNLCKNPCFQERIVSLLFIKKERDKRMNQYKMKNLKIYLIDGLQKPLFFEPLRGALFETLVWGGRRPSLVQITLFSRKNHFSLVLKKKREIKE